MAKRESFPVKSFKLSGSKLSEEKRLLVIRDVRTGCFIESTWKAKAPKARKVQKVQKVQHSAAKSYKKTKPGAHKSIDVGDTATGSGQVSFSFVKRPTAGVTDRSKKRA